MITYAFEPENNQSAAYDDGRQIGVCQYVATAPGWAIVHTEVLPEYGGRGIARKLVEIVAQAAEEAGETVIPVCSYAKKVLSE